MNIKNMVIMTQSAFILIAVAFLLTACNPKDSSTDSPTRDGDFSPAGASASQAQITASPNPVPASDTINGKTTISWKLLKGENAEIFVSQNGGEENLFSKGTAEGSAEAPWIQAGITYEFRVYAEKDHTKPLGSIKVTRATP